MATGAQQRRQNMVTTKPHFLLVTYPAQGHINPALQFAKRLIRTGAHVTFATSLSARRRMKESLPDGMSFAPFSDGYDDGFKVGSDDPRRYMSQISSRGSQSLNALILAAAEDGRPFTCLVYTLLLPWAGEVAHAHGLPVALLWIQAATVFDIYYHYFNGYSHIFSHCNDPSYVVNLPGLPSLTTRDLPSFLLPTNPYAFLLSSFQEQLEQICKETSPKVLLNTFDDLESESLLAIRDKCQLIGIGPLIPSAFLDGKDPSDTSFGGDLFRGGEDYMEWLDSKPKSSVVYVSFGTLAVLSKPQMEALARGLLASGLPFLWVIRSEDGYGAKLPNEEDNLMGFREELEQQGVIVPWCCQVQVLSHPSVGCFVTHCGWNSTLESLATGIPVVAFPQWTDQGTNAKLIEDVWKTGMRVVANQEGIVESEEIKRCLDLVVGSGEVAEDIKRNAKKWKDLARDAAKEGGSSNKNLKAFVDEVGARSC
ncbi:hypothetical protein Tsubulata_036102 [Turnera subulata]|uniref:Glycosyltransferase n=1 Tax=Turnera subulata TaxID=218843 RepID=A0A9Q0J103_9ROSI|nr:hypothetical protein Tsubulata_036102 [Turnera subulata]